MWNLHAMLAETHEQDLRRRIRERHLVREVIRSRRRDTRLGHDRQPSSSRRGEVTR
jgi:hypothetical protein